MLAHHFVVGSSRNIGSARGARLEATEQMVVLVDEVRTAPEHAMVCVPLSSACVVQ